MKTALGLGTVQLGMSYGNKAHLEVMNEQEALRILQTAKQFGIDYYDTASGYGKSEERLGHFLSLTQPTPTRVASKIPPVSKEIWENKKTFTSFVFECIDKSLKSLKAQSIDTILFHQCGLDFLEHPAVRAAIKEVLNRGLCKKFGVSVYETEQAHAAIAIDNVSCLQIPINILDQRFLSPKLLTLYKSKDIELVGRSVFLQGLLVENADLPKVSRWAELSYLKGLCIDAIRKNTIQSLESFSLNFVLTQFTGSLQTAIIGVQSQAELEENFSIISRDLPENHLDISESLRGAKAYALEKQVLNPGHWNL